MTLHDREGDYPEFPDDVPLQPRAVSLASPWGMPQPVIDWRPDWNAMQPKSNPGGFTALDNTVCHYTANNHGYAIEEYEDHSLCRNQVRSIQSYHQSIPEQSDIEYNALACNHGVLFEGRVLGYKGGANGSADSNKRMPSVCVLLGVNDRPSNAMLNAVAYFHWKVEQRAGRQLVMLGHRQVYATSCPGDIMFDYVANEYYRDIIDGTYPPITPPGDDDMAQPDIVQINEPWGPFPTGAVMICAPDCMTFRWVKSEDELWQLQQTFARRGWVFPNPIPPIPSDWLAQYGELIGTTP